MTYIMFVLVAVCAVELFLRIPLIPCGREVITYANEAIKVIASKTLPDHRKEKILLHYSGAIAKSTFKISVFLLIILLLIYILLVLIEKIFNLPKSIFTELATFEGILITVIVSASYAILRIRIVRS